MKKVAQAISASQDPLSRHTGVGGARETSGRVTALIFDVDGTLAETEYLHLDAFNIAFQEAGLDLRWSVPLYTELLAVSGSSERIRHYLAKYRPDFDPPGELATFVSNLHASKNRAYWQLMEQGELALRPGVERLLREAHARGVRLGVATTTGRENVLALVDATLGPDARDWFDAIAAGNEVKHKKPDPAIYDLVLERLGVPASECVAVEDSQNGLRSALGAGLRTVVTPSDFSAGHDFTGAAVVLDCLGEPERPFQCLAGDPRGAQYVDLAFLDALAHGD